MAETELDENKNHASETLENGKRSAEKFFHMSKNRTLLHSVQYSLSKSELKI